MRWPAPSEDGQGRDIVQRVRKGDGNGYQYQSHHQPRVIRLDGAEQAVEHHHQDEEEDSRGEFGDNPQPEEELIAEDVAALPLSGRLRHDSGTTGPITKSVLPDGSWIPKVRPPHGSFIGGRLISTFPRHAR